MGARSVASRRGIPPARLQQFGGRRSSWKNAARIVICWHRIWNAGVHLPHAMAYPVAGQVEGYLPAGYDTDHSMVPHGTSVIVHTPAVCRFTAPSAPERHLQAAHALGADINGASLDDAGDLLAERVTHFMKLMEQPGGIKDFGYSEADIPRLVDGTLVQARLLRLSPLETGADELVELFRNSLKLY